MKTPPPKQSAHGHSDWEAELQAILDQFNAFHGRYPKGVSYKTQEDRAYVLFYCFRLLRKDPGKFKKLMPRNLGERHIRYLVEYWVKEGKAPGTIQAYLSILRTYCNWIRKPGMVQKAEAYVSDPRFVKRRYVARRDKGWTANGVLREEKIAEARAFDPRVGVQLLMQQRFAMRVKEALMCRPRLAEVDGHLMLTSYTHTYTDVQAYLALTALEVKRGTKGGRLRYVPIDTPEKRVALEEAKRLVGHDRAHLGDPTRTLKQNRRRFNYVMERCGITKAQLGVTAHGQRHQYAGDLYEKLTGTPAPVRDGRPVERNHDRSARLIVAQHLGHSRESVSRAYLGGVLKGKPGGGSADPSPPEGQQGAALPPESSDLDQGDE